MGLDMSIYRFPRYKHYGPKEMMAANEYFDWLESEEGQKHTFTEWCGVKEEDLPRKEDLEFFKGLRKESFWDWDEEHKYPHIWFYDEVAYWRKANAVHKWFVDHVQGGEDDCDWHDEVTQDVLEELRDICKEIIEKVVLVNGKVENGYTFEGGRKVIHYEDGKTVLNKDVCEELLPSQSGFFFGGTDYDEWYMFDVKKTYDICVKLLAETDFEHQMLYYSSSW